jgi:hypothetical protein
MWNADMTLSVRLYSAGKDVQLQNERNGANRAGRHIVSAEMCTVLPSFVYTDKLLRNLKLLIPGLLRVNPHCIYCHVYE